jgi:hypothetical protein
VDDAADPTTNALVRIVELSQRMILKYRYGASKASSSRQAITKVGWRQINKSNNSV